MSAAPLRRLAAARGGLIGVGAALVALAAWWLVPRPSAMAAREPALRAVLVDASASVVRRRPDWLPWARARLADEARAALAAGEHVAVVVFADGVELRARPGPPEDLLARLEGRAGAPFDPSLRDDGASDLAGALAVALGAVLDPRRPPGAVVLLGDGGSTGRDPAPALARLLAAGVRTRRVEPPPAALGDAALVALEAPDRVELGAPLLVRAVLDLAPPLPDEIVVHLELEGSAGIKNEVVSVAVPPGGGRVVVPIDVGPAPFGRTRMRGRLLVAGGDPSPENDRAACTTLGAGELVSGAVASAGAQPELAAWIARGGAALFPGMQVILLEPHELAGAILDLDCLVTFDVPLDALPRALIEPFVLRGGGWLAISGWAFLRDWSPNVPGVASVASVAGGAGDAGDGLHALLPLVPAPIESGPRDVVLLVDGSGSMAGEPFDLVRAAAVEMVAAAPPRDEIELRFFTTALERPHVLRRGAAGDVNSEGARESAARSLFAARVPGGSTWILACLDQLAVERERRNREALVLLLTDGREAGAYPDPAAKAAELVERFRAARTELRVIAVGQDADHAFLERLVAPGDALVRADLLDDLELIFQREVNRARVVDAAAIPVRRSRGDALADELLAPVGAPELPPLVRVVRDEMRPGATLLWESADGDPVLAAWRVGLGRAALFASAPRAGWGDAWIGAAERFGALLRWLGRGPERGGTRDAPRARIDTAAGSGSGSAVLVVEGLPADAPPRLPVRLLDPLRRDAEVARLELVFAPRHATDAAHGRRAAALAPELVAAAAGGHWVAAVDGVGAAPLGLPVALPPPAEFFAAPDVAAGATGWGTGPPPAAERERPDRAASGAAAERVAPAAPALLAIGLALVFAGAALGRFGVRVQASASLRR